MSGDRVNIRFIHDVRPPDGSTGFTTGSELLVHTTTAAALVFSGAAIQLPARVTP